jgi:hypothetical protein
LHLSAYVNLNNKVHRLNNKTSRSSWLEYVDGTGDMCRKDIVLDQFKKSAEYKDFAESSLKDILERKKLFKEMENMLFD